jgi:hypothetical protein
MVGEHFGSRQSAGICRTAMVSGGGNAMFGAWWLQYPSFSWGTIPRSPREQQAQTAKIGDARENESAPDKARKHEESPVHCKAEDNSQNDQGSCSDAYLTFQADDTTPATLHGQPSRFPSSHPTFDYNGIASSFFFKDVRGMLGTAPRLAEDVKLMIQIREDRRDGVGVQLMQGDELGAGHVHPVEFRR